MWLYLDEENIIVWMTSPSGCVPIRIVVCSMFHSDLKTFAFTCRKITSSGQFSVPHFLGEGHSLFFTSIFKGSRLPNVWQRLVMFGDLCGNEANANWRQLVVYASFRLSLFFFNSEDIFVLKS